MPEGVWGEPGGGARWQDYIAFLGGRCEVCRSQGVETWIDKSLNR